MPKVRIYNFLTRKKEIFKPIRKNQAGLYTCGPTVYNYAHIGNLRTYIFEDILRRILEYAGYKVKQVMNITDVDDKIIQAAQKTGKNIFEFTRPYEKEFLKDLKKLDIERAWKYPRATEHILEMIKLINVLLKKKLAYRADGSIYFDISKFKTYGRLSRTGRREVKAGTRAEADEYAKHSLQDFVLWKRKKNREPSWKAPFGEGRPGWHLECSAMSMKYLGAAFDIHAGGVDLLFPHHENEIAQSEAATGKKFVRYFMEGEHLLINGQKMSKSLGNIYTLRDLEKKGFKPLAFRYLVLTSHYRSKLNFTWKSVAAGQNSLERLYDFVRELAQSQKSKVKSQNHISKFKSDFEAAVSNDLDTSKALAVIWNLVRQYNKNPQKFNSKEVLKLLYDFDKVLGLNLKKIKPEIIPEKIIELAKKREEFRKNKKWREADKIREKIRALGYSIEDFARGFRLNRER